MKITLRDQSQLCFLHQPKTGGMTVDAIISNHFHADDKLPLTYWEDIMALQEQGEDVSALLSQYRYISGHFLYSIEKFLPATPLYITVLRDPIERALSYYSFMRYPWPNNPKIDKFRNISFSEFLSDEEEVVVISNAQVRRLSHDKDMSSAVMRLEGMACFGLTHRLREFINLLCYTFSWPPPTQLPRVNVTPEQYRLSRSDLSAHDIAQLESLNMTELKLLETANQLFDERYHTFLNEALVFNGDDMQISRINELTQDMINMMLVANFKLDRVRKEHPQTRIEYTFDHPIRGTGWSYERKRTHDDRTVRWTSDTIASLIFNLDEHYDYQMKLSIRGAISAGSINSSKVLINQIQIPTEITTDDTGDILVEGTIPKWALEQEHGLAEIVVVVDPSKMNYQNEANNMHGIPFGHVLVEAITMQKATNATDTVLTISQENVQHDLSIKKQSDMTTQKVSDWWSDQQRSVGGVQWIEVPQVYRNVNLRATNDPAIDWITHSADFISHLTYPRRALSLACGFGVVERRIREQDICQIVDGVDVAEGAIQAARQMATESKLSGLNFDVLDLNTAILPAEQYDVVYAHAALHHLFNLEHALTQIRRTLRPDGVLIVFDYVGPSQMQFPASHLMLADKIIRLIPEQYRQQMRFEGIKTEAMRLTLEGMNEADPSEGIRSQEIVALIASRFRFKHFRLIGGTLTMLALNEVAGNFHDGDPNVEAILDLLIYLENVMIDTGVLPSYHAYMICEKTDNQLIAQTEMWHPLQAPRITGL